MEQRQKLKRTRAVSSETAGARRIVPFRNGEVRETKDKWFPDAKLDQTPEQVLSRASHGFAPSTESCSICLDDFPAGDFDCLKLDKCTSDHFFHRACILSCLSVNPRCPNCMVAYGVSRGTQPPGHMTVSYHEGTPLPGETSKGTFSITYNFPSGIQGPQHPNPGSSFYGTSRRAFLPGSLEGQRILEKFMMAWDSRLLFTVGTSVTTGQENSVIWNGIHHKTSVGGGPCNFGFPDPTYLARVDQELASAGIL